MFPSCWTNQKKSILFSYFFPSGKFLIVFFPGRLLGLDAFPPRHSAKDAYFKLPRDIAELKGFVS